MLAAGLAVWNEVSSWFSSEEKKSNGGDSGDVDQDSDTEKKKPEVSGKTSSGHPIDKYGNKIGPSGYPQVNKVNHPNEKAAREAARNDGKSAPVKHSNPKKGDNHYHPTDKKGNKIPGSTHHEYPKK